MKKKNQKPENKSLAHIFLAWQNEVIQSDKLIEKMIKWRENPTPLSPKEIREARKIFGPQFNPVAR